MGLLQQRASSVSGYLRSKGILGYRLEATGFGECQPIASNGNSAGRQLNRRVAITLLPIEGS